MNHRLVKIESILDFTKDEDTLKTNLKNFKFSFVNIVPHIGISALTSLYIIFTRFLTKYKSYYINYKELQKYNHTKNINDIINHIIYEDMNKFQDLRIINKTVSEINLLELSVLEIRKILLHALLRHLEPIEKKDI